MPRSRSLYVVAALVIIIIAGALILSRELDPYVRARVQQTMNRSLKGYHTTLANAHVNILDGTLSLSDLTIIQDVHPSPPVGHIPFLSISIEWPALIHWRVVADCLIDRPDLHINLTQLDTEASSKLSLRQHGWQNAIQNIYPFKIDVLQVRDGKLTYIDADPNRPLRLDRVNIISRNIRNIKQPSRPYPSTIAANAVVFGTGYASIQGRANFLTKPVASLRIKYQLSHVPLAALQPAVSRVNLVVTGGLFASDGTVDYSPALERVEAIHAAVDGVKIEYIHRTTTAQAEARHLHELREAASHSENEQHLVLRIDDLRLTNGIAGYRDEAASTPYRLYISGLGLDVTGLSNQSAQGTSAFKLNGLFMGTGKTLLTGDFRPRKPTPDFSLDLAIANTQLPALNNLLRSYGRFDVQSGLMSVYSHVTVQNNQISGYVKPLFTDIQVYNYNKDKKQPLMHQAYELVVGGVAHLLTNHSTQAVATKVNLSGQFQQPNVSDWQAFVELLHNAFVHAIVPGFDRQEKIAARQSS